MDLTLDFNLCLEYVLTQSYTPCVNLGQYFTSKIKFFHILCWRNHLINYKIICNWRVLLFWLLFSGLFQGLRL